MPIQRPAHLLLLLACALPAFGQDEAPTPASPSPAAGAASSSDVDRLRKELEALIARSQAQAKEGRLALERDGVGLATLALYDQMTRFLGDGNAVGADETFRTDIQLRAKSQALYRSLRIAFLEDIPRARKALADAEQAAVEHRVATDPAYRAEVELQRATAAAAAKAEAERKVTDVAAIKDLASGVSISADHPLQGLIKPYRDAYKAALAHHAAPAHQRLTTEQVEAFVDEQTKLLQAIPPRTGATTWAVASSSFAPRFRQKEQVYTLNFAVGPTKMPLGWVTCSAFPAPLVAETVNISDWGGRAPGVLLAGLEPNRAVRDVMWWAVLRAPSLDVAPMMGVEVTFDPRDNDLIGGIKRTGENEGMFVFTVDGTYGWRVGGNKYSGDNRADCVLVDICSSGRSIHWATLQAQGCRLTALRHVKRDGAVTSLVPKP